MAEELNDSPTPTEAEEYGYPLEENKGKSWLDLILDYVKSKKESSTGQLQKVG
jgi:hypothetical protein